MEEPAPTVAAVGASSPCSRGNVEVRNPDLWLWLRVQSLQRQASHVTSLDLSILLCEIASRFMISESQPTSTFCIPHALFKCSKFYGFPPPPHNNGTVSCVSEVCGPGTWKSWRSQEIGCRWFGPRVFTSEESPGFQDRPTQCPAGPSRLYSVSHSLAPRVSATSSLKPTHPGHSWGVPRGPALEQKSSNFDI